MKRLRAFLALAVLAGLVLETAAALLVPRDARAALRPVYAAPAVVPGHNRGTLAGQSDPC